MVRPRVLQASDYVQSSSIGPRARQERMDQLVELVKPLRTNRKLIGQASEDLNFGRLLQPCCLSWRKPIIFFVSSSQRRYERHFKLLRRVIGGTSRNRACDSWQRSRL